MAIKFLNNLETSTGSLTITKATTDPLLYLYNTTNGSGATIRFSDQNGGSQTGDITFYHSDGSSQGGGASWHFASQPDTVLVVGSSINNGRFVSKSAGSAGEVDYGFYDDVNTGMYRSAADTVRLVAGGVSGVNVSVNTVDLRYAGSIKLQTTSTGVDVTGSGVFSGGSLTINSTSNAILNVNGTADSFIEKDTGTGHLYFANNVGDKDIKFRVKDNTTNVVALTIDGSEGGDSTFAAQAFSAATSSGDVSSTLTTKGYVDAGDARVTPAAPSTITSTIVGETIEIAFNQSSTSNIDYYQVWSSDDGGDYGIIAQITPADFSSTMTVVDTTFVTGGTMSYRVFAVREGIYSTAGTTSKAYTVSALSVTDMTVVNLNTAYYIQYEKPTSRFIDHVEIYMDSQTTSAALSRSNATIVYSGQNASYMRNVNTSSNFHQFWVEIVTS